MKLEKKLAGAAPLLASSANAEEISLTLKGLVPLALVVLVHFGLDLSADDLLQLIELGVAVGSAIAAFVGLVRKIVVKNRG